MLMCTQVTADLCCQESARLMTQQRINVENQRRAAQKEDPGKKVLPPYSDDLWKAMMDGCFGKNRASLEKAIDGLLLWTLMLCTYNFCSRGTEVRDT